MRLPGKFFKILYTILKSIDTRRLQNKNFVIISNNCFGAELYKWVDKPYNTPFVGLFLHGDCYVKLLQDFDNLITQNLNFINYSKYYESKLTYPVACFEGTNIEIHFMHYKSIEEASEKWHRRLERMLLVKDKNNYFFKICDRDGGTIDVIKQFHELPFQNKVSFSIYSLEKKVSHHFRLVENIEGLYVPDGILLYQTAYKYFDIVYWLRTKKIKKHWLVV